jgi:aspartate-semialdehyde dehydrogenase
LINGSQLSEFLHQGFNRSQAHAFNLFCHDSKIDPDTGYNEEETKMLRETRKIFADPDIRIAATCVRVPVLRAHAEALTVEFGRPIEPDEVRRILAEAPGVRVVDERRRAGVNAAGVRRLVDGGAVGAAAFLALFALALRAVPAGGESRGDGRAAGGSSPAR